MTSLYLNRAGILDIPPPDHPSLVAEAEWLLTCTSNGAICEEPPDFGGASVRPYMANYGCMGLARAYEVTSNPAYLTACWNWLAWYRDHMDPTTGYVNDYNRSASFSDDFNRADGSVGNGWSIWYGSSAVVSGNQLVGDPGGDAIFRDLGSADIDVSVDVVMSGGVFRMEVYVGCLSDVSSPGQVYYLATLTQAGDISLYRRVSGTGDTLLATATVSGFTGSGTLRVSKTGTNLVAYFGGVQMITATATSASSGTGTAFLTASTVLLDNITIIPGWVDDGNKDSTDAYAGTYLVALYLTYWADPDGDTNLVPFAASIPLALTAIESTQQSDGLTYALPTYDVKYLEDNIETLAGVRAAQSMGALTAVSSTQPGVHARAQTTGDALAQGIGYMWNHDAGTWDYAIHGGGGIGRAYAHNNWSDENAQRQQVWATGWGAVASEAEGRSIMAGYVAALPGWATQFSGYEPMPVWGYWHVNQTAEANAGAATVEATGVSQNRGYPWTCQISGLVLVGLLGFSNAMPSPLVIFPAGVNLMPDPQFLVDSNSDGRADVITGTYGAPTTSLHPLAGGGNYQSLDTPDGNGWAVNWDPIAVEENTYVTFSLWERMTRVGAGGTATIQYELYDSSHNFVTYGYNQKFAVDGPDFHRWYINAWIPPGIAYLKPVLGIASAGVDIAYPQVEVSGSPTAPPYGVPVPAALLPFSDDFTRADGELGAAWQATDWVIDSGTVYYAGVVDGGYAIHDVGASDVRAGFTFTVIPPVYGFSGNASAMGVLVRGSADNQNHYLFHAGSGGNVAVYKRVSGTYTLLWDGSLSGGPVLAAGDQMELEVLGTALTAYVNGSSVWSSTDSDVISGTYVGLRCGGAGSERNVSHVDGFYAVTVTAFVDNFHRADGAIGNGWSSLYDTAVISGNKAVCSTVYSTYGRDTGSADADVSASFILGTDYYATCYVLARVVDADNGFKFGYEYSVSRFVCYSTVSGVPTEVLAVSASVVGGTAFTLRLVISGSSVHCYRDGTLLGSAVVPGGSVMGTKVGFQVSSPNGVPDACTFFLAS